MKNYKIRLKAIMKYEVEVRATDGVRAKEKAKNWLFDRPLSIEPIGIEVLGVEVKAYCQYCGTPLDGGKCLNCEEQAEMVDFPDWFVECDVAAQKKLNL